MDITPEDFERFLTWLDPDREQAIAKYQEIHTRLIRLFLYRGWDVIVAEELTDETINRVMIKLRKLADSYVGERMPYLLTVARFVDMEHRRRVKEEERQRRLNEPIQEPVSDSSKEKKEKRDRCLRRCMRPLTPENRDLILRYYTGDKHDKIVERKKLADESGIAPNALRIRAHRIRTELRRCVEKCVDDENVDDENVDVANIAKPNAKLESVTEENTDEID